VFFSSFGTTKKKKETEPPRKAQPLSGNAAKKLPLSVQAHLHTLNQDSLKQTSDPGSTEYS
jgi:hypothetical protein